MALRRRTSSVLLITALAAASCGSDDDPAADGSPAGATSTADPGGAAGTPVGEAADDGVRVLALGEERLLADLLALGIRPVASTANVVVTDGFVGMGDADTSGIESLLSTDRNLERLAAFDVDVVVAGQFVVDEVGAPLLEGLGRLVVVPDGGGVEQVEALGDAFDLEAEADALVTELDEAIAAGREAVEALEGADRTLTVATIYPGPTVAAWVDGPVDVPLTLQELGFTLRPGPEVDGASGGRVYLSEEQIGILDGPTMVLLQSDFVEGEPAAIEAVEADPRWNALPAVADGRVITIERLGYAGIDGRIRLVDDLVEALVP